MISRRSFVAGAVTVSFAPPVAVGSARKPKLPPGRDPGGVAVAIIGGGVDYADPMIAARLARDGEGDLIGWDFVDNDNRPFAIGDSSVAELRSLIDLSPSARFIPIRIPRGDQGARLHALGFALQTPARLILFVEAILKPEDIESVRAMSRIAPTVLVIAAGDSPAASQAGNLLLVSDPAAGPPAIQRAVRLIDTERIVPGEALKQRLLASPELLRRP